MKRGSFSKISDSLPMARCFYCKALTNSALNLPDGSEVWSCEPCAGKHGKIRRFQKKGYLSIPKQKYDKIIQKSLVNSGENRTLTDLIPPKKNKPNSLISEQLETPTIADNPQVVSLHGQGILEPQIPQISGIGVVGND